MAGSLAQQLSPEAFGRARAQQNVFYPQAMVTLSVVFENFGDPEAPKAFRVTPHAITVNSNSFKEADTWSVTFDAKDLPISPDLIRGGSAEIYLFQQRGLGGANIPQVLQASGSFAPGVNPSIVGLFDDVSIEFTDGGRTVSISGTDYTALFLAKQWDPRKSGNAGRVPSGVTLDEAIKQLMRQTPSADAMTLKVVSNEPLPRVGVTEAKTNKKGIPVAAGKSYWDVMYSLAVRYGYILFVQNLELVLVRLEDYLAEKQANVRKMAWGRNIRSLKLSRRIGKEQVPIIEARSYSAKTRKIIKAQYPTSTAQVPVTGLGTKREEIFQVFLPGVESEKQLREMAKNIYDVRSRAEQKMQIETMDLRDLEGSDLIELRSGDAISIIFDPFNSDAVLLDGQSGATRMRTLIALGYDEEVAKTISEALDKVSFFRAPFRVREATIEYSKDGGISIEAEVQNFVNPRGKTP